MSRLESTLVAVVCLFLALTLSPETTTAKSEEVSDQDTNQPSDADPPENLHRRPAITVHYGIASLDRDGFESTFADAGLLGLQIGFRHQTGYMKRNHLVQHRFGGLSAELLSSEISAQEPGSGELEVDLWRFGFVDIDGHGYRINRGRGSIEPYNLRSMGWSFFDLRDGSAPPENGADSSMIAILEDQMRFGVLWQGGVRLSPTDRIGLNIGYERSLVFPWTKVWYTILSMGIEELALGAVDEFIEEIADTSPGAVPVVEFLLKSGVSYALFELRQEKMNWPFDTAAPLAYDTFKVGVTTTF